MDKILPALKRVEQHVGRFNLALVAKVNLALVSFHDAAGFARLVTSLEKTSPCLLLACAEVHQSYPPVVRGGFSRWIRRVMGWTRR